MGAQAFLHMKICSFSAFFLSLAAMAYIVATQALRRYHDSMRLNSLQSSVGPRANQQPRDEDWASLTYNNLWAIPEQETLQMPPVEYGQVFALHGRSAGGNGSFEAGDVGEAVHDSDGVVRIIWPNGSCSTTIWPNLSWYRGHPR